MIVLSSYTKLSEVRNTMTKYAHHIQIIYLFAHKYICQFNFALSSMTCNNKCSCPNPHNNDLPLYIILKHAYHTSFEYMNLMFLSSTN